MGIRGDIELTGSDGDKYRYDSRRGQFCNIRTGRICTRAIRMELEGEVLDRGLVEGDNIFRELLELSRIAGYIDPERDIKSREWMREATREVIKPRHKVRSEILTESEFRGSNGVSIGRPCMFYYEAKGAKELPYYDQFPVIIPIERGRNADGSNYFMGLNLHYLRYEYRAAVMDMLYSEMLRNSRDFRGLYEKEMRKIGSKISGGESIYTMTKNSYLDISYRKIAKGVTRYKVLKPTIKKYLVSHVKSRIVEITPRGWTMCFFLPTAKFVGASESKVQSDSEKKMK